VFYAIVFTREFVKGQHWTDHLPDPKQGQKFLHGKHKARADDPDRTQDWLAGQLYSTGTVLGALPDHLEAIEFPEPPPAGAQWDVASKMFIVPQA